MERQGANGNNRSVNEMENKQRISNIMYQKTSPLSNGICWVGVLAVDWSVEMRGREWQQEEVGV